MTDTTMIYVGFMVIGLIAIAVTIIYGGRRQ